MKTGHWGFWLTTLGVLGMTLSFSVAGVLQTYLERVEGAAFMEAAEPIRFWMFMAFLHGLVVAAGVTITITHLLTLRSLGAVRHQALIADPGDSVGTTRACDDAT